MIIIIIIIIIAILHHRVNGDLAFPRETAKFHSSHMKPLCNNCIKFGTKFRQYDYVPEIHSKSNFVKIGSLGVVDRWLKFNIEVAV